MVDNEHAVLSASLCVCLFVSSLMAEPFDIWARNLVHVLTLMISWTGLDKFDQGHRSKVKVTRSET